MALHDVDKQQHNRSIPRPNSTDEQYQRMAHGTNQIQNSIETARADGLKFYERQIVAKNNGANKAVLGFLDATGKFGFRVAQDNIDVFGATDDQLIFNSDNNLFKIVKSDPIYLNFTASGASSGSLQEEYDHDLGYVPKIIAEANIDEGLTNFSSIVPYVLLPHVFWASDGTALAHFEVAVDETKFYFKVSWRSALPAGDYMNTCYFNLLQETFKS